MFAEAEFSDATAVPAAARQVGGDVVITLDPHNVLVLKNVALGGLCADDFRFMV